MLSWLLIVMAVPQAATPVPTPAPAFPITILKAQQGDERPAGSQSLADVAKRIKLNIPSGQKAILNNETVKTWSQGVELTTAASAALPPARGAVVPIGREAGTKAAWQQRYQASRGKILYLESEVSRLRSESARLENEFYARDDPAYRDGVIKPAWDKARADLEQAQRELEKARQGPDNVLSEAQKEGAQPGWFRGLPEPSAASGAPPTPTPKGAKKPRLIRVEPRH
ncbi:MAG: hypothetical protein ACM3O7_01300 [Acidobacteriota bacterium]